MRRDPRAFDPLTLLPLVIIPFIPAIIRTLTEPDVYTFTVKVDGEEREITITKEDLEKLKEEAA